MKGSKLFVIICMAVFCALELHDCSDRQAHAGVTDDATAMRRSIEHIEHMIEWRLVHADSDVYKP